MDFELTDEQQELQRIAREVAARDCPTSLMRAVVEDGADTDALWKTMVALEWPGLTVPVEHGGSGATAVELAVLVQELGRAGDPSPLLATATQHLPLVRDAMRGPERDRRLTAIAAGSPGAASFDPDAVTARRDGDGWVLAGTVTNVLDGDRAEELAVVGRAGEDLGVFLVPIAAVTATRETTFDASLHVATVALDGVRVADGRATVGSDVPDGVARARDEALIGLAARMVGGSDQILDMALQHLRERHQFGVPIGSFQAVKHMAVDAFTSLQRAQAVLHFAALTIADGGTADRTLGASMAKAAAGDAQRIAVQHGIQFFGGIGYTWENDLQLFVRRVKAGDTLLGGARQHRQIVSRRVLERITAGDGPVTVTFDDATEAVRDELVAWLHTNAPSPEETAERSGSSADIPGWARAWQRKMFDAGWLVPGNPPEHGGRNAGLLETFVVQEELGRQKIYPSFNPQGLSIIVPSILAFGSEDQKERWALPILRGELTAALGMSEPDAGSDLAGLRTRAVLDGDRFIVNGQKVWTSGAHDADVILAFVRTDPDAPKHKGISCLLIPTDTTGVTRRPFGSIQSRDELDFNEVFFEDAVVPAENLVGELHEGWRVATGSLGHERAMLWLGYAERLDYLVEQGGQVLLDHGLADDAYALDWFGQLVTDNQALRMLGYRTLAEVRRGGEPKEQSILKLFGSEAVQRATLHVLEAVGADALDPTVRTAPFDHLDLEVWTDGWFDLYLRSFSATIAGGTSQIQRNIVAERVLDLPR